jgi:hypothetical protein
MTKGDVIKRRAAEVAATGEPATRLVGHPEILAAIHRAPREKWHGLLEHTLLASATLEQVREKVNELLPPKEPVEPQSRRKRSEGTDEDEEAVEGGDEEA